MGFRTGRQLGTSYTSIAVAERTNTVPVKGTPKSLAITRNPQAVAHHNNPNNNNNNNNICDFCQLENTG